MKLSVMHILKKYILGSDLTFAATVLHLIATFLGKVPSEELARFVFRQLPQRWKDPLGHVSEAELIEMIETGIRFFKAARQVVV